jgi:NitT/TauT family transport system permease protein
MRELGSDRTVTGGTSVSEATTSSMYARGQGSGAVGAVVKRAWRIAKYPVLRIAVAFVVLAAWQLASGRIVDRFWVSTPIDVAQAIGDLAHSHDFWISLRYTMYSATVGLAIGSLCGIVLGLLLASNQTVDRVMSPFATVLNTIPRFALAPLFIVYFGIGTKSKIILVISLVVFVLMTNTYAGRQSVDRDLQSLMMVLGAKRHQIFTKLYLPTIIPWIFAGLHLSLAYALASTVVGEMIGAQYGLGVLISRESGLYNLKGVFALLVVLSAAAIILDLVISAAERRLLAWRYIDKSSTSRP